MYFCWSKERFNDFCLLLLYLSAEMWKQEIFFLEKMAQCKLQVTFLVALNKFYLCMETVWKLCIQRDGLMIKKKPT